MVLSHFSRVALRSRMALWPSAGNRNGRASRAQAGQLSTEPCESRRSLMYTKRKSWLHAVAASACLWMAQSHNAAAQDTIKIGILHSLSGTMAISETILKDLMLMQVAEQNAKGGLL